MRRLGKTHHIHFVGVGGIGMSGIAELLVNQGYVVSGSDLKASEVTDRLATLGVTIGIGHRAEHVSGAVDAVVYTSAARADNPELAAARARQIPVIPRAELLGELMRLEYGIAIAGAHGKTTVTSMIALVLERAGLDPTAVIGGRLSAFGSNARLGRGACMVAEADESDRSFLKLYPTIAVLTNVDREHMEAYGTFNELLQAFVDFANRVPFYGSVVACADDPHLQGLGSRLTRRVVTYGLTRDEAHITAGEVTLDGFGSRCVVRRRLVSGERVETLGPLTLNVPGRHSVQNALAAVAVALELDVPFDRIATALSEFTGVERRFQQYGVVNGVRVVDDYGHHPTEIAAVLAAARAAKPARIVAAFQPHRYTRTRDLMREFGLAFAAADEVVLTEIYAASEEPLPGVTIEALAASLNECRPSPVHLVPQLDQVPAALAGMARTGDLVILFGAGSIGRLPNKVVAALRHPASSSSTIGPVVREESERTH